MVHHMARLLRIIPILIPLLMIAGGFSSAAANECDEVELKLQKEQEIILEREHELSEKVEESKEKFEQDELSRLIQRHHTSIKIFNAKLAAFQKECGRKIIMKKKKPTPKIAAKKIPPPVKVSAQAKTSTAKVIPVKKSPSKNEAAKIEPSETAKDAPEKNKRAVNPAEDVAASDELIKTLHGFFIQVGAFKNKGIAERFIKRLEKRGFTPTMITRTYVQAVWVGPYETYKEVNAAKEMLLTKYRVDGYIIRFK